MYGLYNGFLAPAGELSAQMPAVFIFSPRENNLNVGGVTTVTDDQNCSRVSVRQKRRILLQEKNDLMFRKSDQQGEPSTPLYSSKYANIYADIRFYTV